jgi:hypothetical protein
MTDQKTVLFTFHKVREQCEQGDPAAWRAFLDFYTPLALRLLDIYPPGAGATVSGVWEKTLVALSENNFERFRATARQTEREFLADVRALLLDQAIAEAPRESAVPAAENISVSPTLDLATLSKLVEGLPLLHQEMLFFKLAGYTDATLERLMRMAPRVAQEAFARLEPDYAAALKLQSDRCPWPREWLVVLREARTKKQEACPHPHQFLRIHDGQVSWYDKDPVEKHVAGCLRCLEAWTALREVGYGRHAAQGVPAVQITAFLKVLPLAAPAKKSLLRRVFG